MEVAQSNTAISTAVARGRHRLCDDSPWLLDDPYALVLAGPVWRVVEKRSATRYSEPVDRAMRGGIVGRSRYAEDRLVPDRYGQYVILGAGLDSFIWRQPELTRSLQVFEIDHPSSQMWKRERARSLALPNMPTVTYLPVDFEIQSLEGALRSADFDWTKPTFISCLGVTMYLSLEAIETTLRTVAAGAPGSEIVFTYAPTDEYLDDIGRQFDRISSRLVAAAGEPIVTRLSRPEVDALVGRCGLEVADHPTHGDLVDRYFASRSDRLTPYTAEGLVAARVPVPGTGSRRPNGAATTAANAPLPGTRETGRTAPPPVTTTGPSDRHRS